jgi:Topoisomerase IA
LGTKNNVSRTEFLCQIDRLKSEEKAKKGLEYLLNKPFEITSFEQKEGKEGNPRLYDLTSLQVEGNKRFGLGAEQTLNLIQSLYEKKLVLILGLDTTYLSEDLHPKIPGILGNLKDYKRFTDVLLQKAIPKSKTFLTIKNN